MDGVVGPYGRLFQIGYVTRDAKAAVARLTAEMGARVIDFHEDFRNDRGEPTALQVLSHLALADKELEVIQPRQDRPSIYLEALPPQDRPEALALHHIGYMQDSSDAWHAAMAELKARGVDVPVEGINARAHFAYLDTRAAIGHYTEVVFRTTPLALPIEV